MQHPRRWAGNWQAVAPPGAVAIQLPGSRRRVKDVRCRLLSLPAGAPVVLRADSLGAKARCRRLLSSARVRIEREYIALPSSQAPGYLVQDSPAGLGYFFHSVVSIPAGSSLAGSILRAGLVVFALMGGDAILGGLAPGRVVVGRRI